MKYNVNRKYALPNYENFDISILETEKDPVEALKEIDEMAKRYIAQTQELPSKNYRIGNDWFVLNQKEDKLYRSEPRERIKIIKKGK